MSQMSTIWELLCKHVHVVQLGGNWMTSLPHTACQDYEVVVGPAWQHVQHLMGQGLTLMPATACVGSC